MAFNSSFFNNMPPVTKNLLIINILIFLVMEIIPGQKAALIEHYGALHYFTSPDFNVAQLATYMFLHGGFQHLFFNMLALLMFGPQIEWALGSKRFLFYYISCGLGAALVQEGVFAIMIHNYSDLFTSQEVHIIAQGYYPSTMEPVLVPKAQALYGLINTPTVGASGAIYGILLAFGMLFPNQQLMLIIPPMPIKAKWLVIGYGVLELVLGFSGRVDGVAHFCHLGGMLAGILIILYWKKNGTFRGYW